MTKERTYLKTHPWLSFQLDLRQIPYTVWVKLGEAQSKCGHIEGVPLKPETATKLLNVYLAKGVLATAAIEGNTLTEEEAIGHINGSLKLPPSQEYLGQELTNIINACNQIKNSLLDGCTLHITTDEIKEYNKLIFQNLSLNEDVIPGEIRRHSVGVGSYRAVPAEDCEFLLDKFVSWLNNDLVPIDGNVIAFNIIKAIVAHVYFAWIHPFADGNGRTARLIELKILLSSGIPVPAAHLLTNHYNQTRQEYYRQLGVSSKSGGDLVPFIEYAVQGYVDGLKKQLKEIQEQQFTVAWENYVHDHFKNMDTPTDVRRRHLVLDLSRQNDNRPVLLAKINEISTRIAASYSSKTKRTVERDINYLVKANLIERSRKGIRAKTENIKAFLPACRKI